MPIFNNMMGMGSTTGKLPNNPIPMTPSQAESASSEHMDDLSNAGVQVNYHSLNGQKLRFHHIPINVTEAGKRYAVSTLAKAECDRIVGITVTSDEAITSPYLSNLNYSTMGLNIDNEEILPDDILCSLFSCRLGCGFYDNMYRFNERADSSNIKINYTPGTTNWPEGGYTVHVYLWCTSKQNTTTQK